MRDYLLPRTHSCFPTLESCYKNSSEAAVGVRDRMIKERRAKMVSVEFERDVGEVVLGKRS